MGGSPAAATTTSSIQLLGSGAKCRMRNNTAAPSGWTGTYFDSSSWPWGVTPVGHLKPVTTDFGAPARTAYLRCPFNVDNADAVTGATLTARVDDGAVLYLNGQEVARTNMPAGADTFNTSASTVDSYDGQRWQTWQISPALLKAYNVLSVSVHQNFVPGRCQDRRHGPAGCDNRRTPFCAGPHDHSHTEADTDHHAAVDADTKASSGVENGVRG